MFSLCWASCTGRKLWVVCSITSAIAACFLLASTLRQQAAEARSAATVDADPQGELVLVQVHVTRDSCDDLLLLIRGHVKGHANACA